MSVLVFVESENKTIKKSGYEIVSYGREVANNLNKSLNIQWNWVKAHDGNPLNEEVDLLAKKAANLD